MSVGWCWNSHKDPWDDKINKPSENNLPIWFV